MFTTLYIICEARLIKFGQEDNVTFDEFTQVSDLPLPIDKGMIYISDTLKYKILDGTQGGLSEQELRDSENILADQEQILEDVRNLRIRTVNGNTVEEVRSFLLRKLDIIFAQNLNHRVPKIILGEQEIISNMWDLRYWFDTISFLSIKINKLNQDSTKGNTNHTLSFNIRNKENTDLQVVTIDLASCVSLIDQILEYRSQIEQEQIQLVKLINDTEDMVDLNNIDLSGPFSKISAIFNI